MRIFTLFAATHPHQRLGSALWLAVFALTSAFALQANAQTIAEENARPSASVASSAAASSPEIADGRKTKSWLTQQASRTHASRTKQTLSGPIMSKVHTRYVNSFDEPIPVSVRDRSSISNR